MRVLIVSNYAPPHIGGVEVLVDHEIRLLSSAGHQVQLITSDCGHGPLPLYPDSVNVVRIRAWNVLERAFQIPWPIFSVRLLPALWKAVRRSDIVHVHGFLGFNTLVALLIAKWMRHHPPTVLTEHAGRIWFAQLWKRWLQDIAIHTFGRLSVMMAHRVYVCHGRVLELLTALASRTKKIALLMFPLKENIFRPPTGIERAQARREFGWEPARPKVLFVGRISARKGADLLLAAKSDRYDLVFCGPGDVSLLSSTDSHKVTYLGQRTQPELLALYHASDVLVAPSRSEGNLLLVVQEALTCGLPVLLGDDPWLERFHECSGLHFCRLEPEAIRKAINEIVDNSNADTGRVPLAEYFPTGQQWIEEFLRYDKGGVGSRIPAPHTSLSPSTECG